MRRLVVPLFLLFACSRGDVEPEIECGLNGECPDGYECDPVTRRCITTGTSIDGGATVPLSLTITGGGTIKVAGQSACAASTCSYNLASGASVSLTAEPIAGGRFVSWSGACSGETATVTVTMSAARSCTAVFADRISVTGAIAGATGNIQARSTDPGATCSAGSCTVDKGGNVSLTAPTLEGFRFVSWSGTGCSGTAPVLQLTNVTASTTCTATYVPGLGVLASVVGAVGTVDASSTSPGAVCQAGGCTIASGSTVVLAAPSIEGFRFTGWSGDAECTGTAQILTLRNVTKSISCSAGYVQRFTVAGVVSGATGAVKASSTDSTASCPSGSSCTVDARGRVTLEAPVITGHTFTGWTGGCAGSDNPLLITNVSANRVCTAVYTSHVTVSGTVAGGPTAPIVASSTDDGSVCEGATCTVSAPGNVLLTAPTAAGFRFSAWSGTAACTGTVNPLVLSGVTADQACVATYVPRIVAGGTVAGMDGALVAATSTDAFADCAAGGSCVLDVPGKVTLTAPAPTAGHLWKGWTGPAGCNSANQVLTLTNLTASVSCVANFTGRITISVTAAGAGDAEVRISSSADGADCSVSECTVDSGSIVSFEVTGGDNFRFVGWDGPPCLGTGLQKSFDMEAKTSGSCTATFVDFRTTLRPVILTRWLNPTGWLDAKGNKIQMTFRPVTGSRFECRTGRTADQGPANIGNQPWQNCDLSFGNDAIGYGVPVAGEPNGSYRTEARLAIVEYRSESVAYDYYAHDSLDRAVVCPEAISDAEVQAIANQLELPTPIAFPATDVTANPFVEVTFSRAVQNFFAWIGRPTPPNPMTLEILSLRHKFTILPRGSSLNRYLVVRRQYESYRQRKYRNVSSCDNGFELGWKWIEFDHDVRTFGSPHQDRIPCGALVLSATGAGYCLQKSAATGGVFSAGYSYTMWEKLVQDESFSRKNRDGCTGESCGLYLPD